MGSRLELHALLVSILGSNHVYFQPPASIQMSYPCIVYERSSNDTKFADDRPYRQTKKYTVTVIDKNPDSAIPDKVAKLPLCKLGRCYTTENLNHDSFDLYY